MKKVIELTIALLICLGLAFSLVIRAEQVDQEQKKELPATTQSNSIEK